MTKITRGSMVLFSSILVIALLIGAVAVFSSSLMYPVSAASVYFSSNELTGTNGTWNGKGRVYIYADNTYINSISFSGFTIDDGPSNDYFSWTGRFTINLKSGYGWNPSFTSITGKGSTAWSDTSSSSNAQTTAYNSAVDGTTLTFRRSGSTFTLSSGTIPKSSDVTAASGYAYGAYVLILNDFNNQIGYNISASVSSDSTDKASVDKVSDICYDGYQARFIYTANEGYSISQVKINNAIVAISEVQPENFAYAVGCEYKCFRNQNQVYVIVTRPWEAITIEASCDILFTTNTLTTDLQVVSSTATSSGSTLDARIILQYNWTPNVRFRLDGGKWNQLVGSNGGGILGASTYSFSRHEAKFYIIIEIYGLSQTTHSVEVDYYAGGGGGITPSVYNNSGYATFEQYVDDNITRVVVTPASNTYVTALYIDNVRFPVQYYRAEVFGAGMATAIQYIAHETNNTFVVLAQDVYRAMAIEFELSNSLPTLQEPPSSGGTLLTGTVATASAGGEVRMTGFSGDETENSTLHFVALAYSGYEFAGWRVDGEILEGYSAIADIPYSLVDGKIVTAVFEPKDADSSTNSSLNDPTHGADIL